MVMVKLIELGLNDDELEAIKECMIASVEGPFFEEWEFQTLFGIERSEVADVVSKWPDIDLKEECAIPAIHNSMGQLIGYPHDCTDLVWNKYISISPTEVRSLLYRWRQLLEKKNLI